MPEGIKFGVYIPEGLANDLEECMRELGIRNKSKLIQEALRSFIADNKWKFKGKAVGAIGVIYDHEVGEVDAELTDIQHNYLDIIVAALHLHLSERKCALYILVNGDSSKVRELTKEIMKVKGVELVKPLLLSTTR